MWNAVRLNLKKNLSILCQKIREVTLWHTRTVSVLSGSLNCCFSCSWVNQLRFGQALDRGSCTEERGGKCYTRECFSFSENAERHSIVLHLGKWVLAVAGCNFSKHQFCDIEIFHVFNLQHNICRDKDIISCFKVGSEEFSLQYPKIGEEQGTWGKTSVNTC